MNKRKIQPEILISKVPDIVKEKKLKTENNIPVYCINAGDQDILKIDFIFKAGKIYHKNPLIPEIVNTLSGKGTDNLSSQEISETFDFYGAYFETETGKHEAVITLYTLTKYFEQTFDLFKKIIFNASFPQKEIDVFLKNRYQSYLIDRKKTDVIASEVFIETIFEKKIYGRIISDYDFNNVKQNDIIDFYNKFYLPENLYVIISGKTNVEIKDNIIDYINTLKVKENLKNNNLTYNFNTPVKNQIRQNTDFSVQSSIRIGKLTINKLHKDYFNLNFATIVLGGYFGSRLMQNIREDKGYTYGIYAYNLSYFNAGYFMISAESGKEFYNKAVDEIYKELKILRTVPVSDNEINRVKKWLLGNILKFFDGPLALSDSYRSILSYNLNSDYFRKYIDAVKNITADKISDAANKYLQEDKMTEVIIGA